ncbi:MAG TPA: ATP-binding cassette domain-containing protein [Bacteroidota bacterium]|nr:ATP-binding cassette domain-containing protein [Bacteroidota bacterium]
MSKIIEVHNFTKTYGDQVAVDNISFDVDEGSVFAFLGPNGAGKTTTISTLCTILEKTSGVLKIAGHDVNADQAKVRRDIGIVFQESILDNNLTVQENLALHCEFYMVPEAEIRERIGFALDLVGLLDWQKAMVKSLSGGMKRRVEIARGLVHFPKVLFLDEPTTGLDPQTRANIWDYICTVQKQKNMTIFMTTHYMDEAEICDKVAIIDHGKIVAFNTPSQLKHMHTSDVVKIKTSDAVGLREYLGKNEIPYSEKENLFMVRSGSIAMTLEMLSQRKDSIIDFEVHKGTLNDVFIAITGKEIRK